MLTVLTLLFCDTDIEVIPRVQGTAIPSYLKSLCATMRPFALPSLMQHEVQRQQGIAQAIANDKEEELTRCQQAYAREMERSKRLQEEKQVAIRRMVRAEKKSDN